MARVTVEDCLEKVHNRFALTVLASRRARQLSESRGTPLVKCSNKAGVTALREISDGGVRYAEDVESTMRDFIEEQRRDLQALSFNEVDFGPGSFGADPDIDGVDYDDDIEELVPDLTRVKPENRNDTDDDDSNNTSMDAVERRAEAEDSETEGEDASGEDSEDSDEDGVEGLDDGDGIELGDLDEDDSQDESQDAASPGVDFAADKHEEAASEAGNA